VLVSSVDVEPALLAERPGQLLLVDKGYRDAQTEAIWHHHSTGQPVTRSLLTYDHYY
jgi:hypothetical protein